MNTATGKHRLGMIATLFGCLAVIAAVLPTWVLPLVLPPDPIDKVFVGTAQKVTDRVIVKSKSVEHPVPARKTNWYSVFSVAAITLGVLALVMGAISFVAHEPWRFAAAAGALGVGAIIFQFSLLVAGALIAILFISVILNALDLSP
jgi:TRAP-type C4-dicarboxylate transport system permease small subunit